MYYTRLLLMCLCLVSLAMFLAPYLGAEESEVYRLGEAGLTKAALAPTLVLCDGPCATEATTAITLATVSGTTTFYRWEDLPDVAAGTSTSRALIWQHDGVVYTYSWPQETRTPQAVINRVSYQVQTNPLEIAAGATLPSASVRVTGLSSDPTGGAATFTLSTSAGTEALSGVSAALSDIDQATDGSWEVTLTHDWTVGETTPLSGSYHGRFTLTLSGGGVIVAPPAPGRLQVRVFP